MGSYMRIGLTVGALALGLTLAGCENFDPTDMLDLDIFNTKKKLPGERQPVFPQGTPGVPQGVPPELVKGYQPAAEPAKEATADRRKRNQSPSQSRRQSRSRPMRRPRGPCERPSPLPKHRKPRVRRRKQRPHLRPGPTPPSRRRRGVLPGPIRPRRADCDSAALRA